MGRLNNVTYSPSHRQVRHPNVKYPVNTSYRSPFGKNVALAVCGSKGNSCTIFMQSDMCIYTHIAHNMETLVGQNKEKNRTVNAACQGSFSASHFGYASHSFVSPALVQSYHLHLLLFPILHSFNLRCLIKYGYSTDTTSWTGVSSKHWFLWHGTAHKSVLRRVTGGF
jgi:hypothetical protein